MKNSSSCGFFVHPVAATRLSLDDVKCLGGPEAGYDTIRRECCTEEALEEARREGELVRIIMVGIPTVDEQRDIVNALDALDSDVLVDRPLSLPESLAWLSRYEQF